MARGRSSKSRDEGGAKAATKNLGELLPLARAIEQKDTETLISLLGVACGQKFAGVDVRQATEEKYTGGHSCPVYKLSCAMEGSYEVLHLVAKVVRVQDRDERAKEIKCRSNQVEAAFYAMCSNRLAAANLTIPKLYLSESKNIGGPFTLVMSDLQHDFPLHPGKFTRPTLKAAARWLASLHATFWGAPKSAPGMWESGAFWDIAKDGACTLENIQPKWAETLRWLSGNDQGMWSDDSVRSFGLRLQSAAGPLSRYFRGDSKVSRTQGFRTLIHGDAKAANMFFSMDEKPIAAVCDFQCAGAGYGAADVAYLLYPDATADHFDIEEEILRAYHRRLSKLLSFRGAAFSLELLHSQYRLAQLDFFRHHIAKSGWVASGPTDIELIRRLQATLYAMDKGTVMSPKQYELGIAAVLA